MLHRFAEMRVPLDPETGHEADRLPRGLAEGVILAATDRSDDAAHLHGPAVQSLLPRRPPRATAQRTLGQADQRDEPDGEKRRSRREHPTEDAGRIARRDV